jgi:hypothetical protein
MVKKAPVGKKKKRAQPGDGNYRLQRDVPASQLQLYTTGKAMLLREWRRLGRRGKPSSKADRSAFLLSYLPHMQLGANAGRYLPLLHTVLENQKHSAKCAAVRVGNDEDGADADMAGADKGGISWDDGEAGSTGADLTADVQAFGAAVTGKAYFQSGLAAKDADVRTLADMLQDPEKDKEAVLGWMKARYDRRLGLLESELGSAKGEAAQWRQRYEQQAAELGDMHRRLAAIREQTQVARYDRPWWARQMESFLGVCTDEGSYRDTTVKTLRAYLTPWVNYVGAAEAGASSALL